MENIADRIKKSFDTVYEFISDKYDYVYINRIIKHNLETFRPDIKVHLYGKNIITDDIHQIIRIYVNDVINYFYEIYPHFMLNSICINLDENNDIIGNYKNLIDLKELKILFDMNDIEISYYPEILKYSIMEFTIHEKIYLSKEKIYKLNLKRNFEELKIMPIEKGESNISFIGEDYRETMANFYLQLENKLENKL